MVAKFSLDHTRTIYKVESESYIKSVENQDNKHIFQKIKVNKNQNQIKS